MKPNTLHSPFLFLLILLWMGCDRPQRNFDEYTQLRSKADTLYKRGRLDSAYFYYNQAKLNLDDKEDENYTYVLLQMATIQQYMGDFNGSEEAATEALENPKDTLYKSYLYNMLAINYDRQKRYDDALSYYQKAFNSFEDKTAKAIALNNIGLIYREKKQPQRAIRILQPLLKNEYLKPRKDQIARVHDNLGYAQFQIDSPEAYSNLLEGLRLRDSLHDTVGIIPSYLHLSEFFMAKDKEKSRFYAEKALNTANTPDDKLESMLWLINTDPIVSGKYINPYIALRDSLDLARNSAKNQFAKYRYDSRKATKDKEQAEQKTRSTTIIAIVVTVLLLLVIYLVRYINRQKYKASVYETETRISKRIHDELANDIFNTMTIAETQELHEKEKKEQFLQEMEKIYHKARNISNENNEIITDAGFETFLKEMVTGYNSEKVRIILKDNRDIDWNAVNKHKKVVIFRAIQELMVNMKKHSQASYVVLGFENSPKAIIINYSDNGIGIDKEKFHKKGLLNAENRIHSVKGTFIFDRKATKGFKATIQIPK